MTKLPALPCQTDLSQPYTWVDQNGHHHLVQDMETGHLFNTISMIWNHLMPKGAETHNYKRYRFGPMHTFRYMAETVRFMIPALLARPDLTKPQLDRLIFMLQYLRRSQGKIPEVLKELTKVEEGK